MEVTKEQLLQELENLYRDEAGLIADIEGLKNREGVAYTYLAENLSIIMRSIKEKEKLLAHLEGEPHILNKQAIPPVSPSHPTDKKRVFKYIKNTPEQPYAANMLDKGQIWVGSIYEYRDIEDEEVGDKMEAAMIASTHIGDRTVNSSEELGAGRHGIKLINCNNVRVVNSTFITQISYPNLLVYCTTYEPSKEVMERFEYQSCIEITDIDKFQQALQEHINSNFSALLRSPLKADYCNYVPVRWIDYETEIHQVRESVYWMKETFFQHQKEHRIVFPTVVNDATLRGQLLTVPGILPFIREHKFE